MDKKKKELILIACLVPVLGFVIYSSLSTVADQKKEKSTPKTTETQTVQSVEVPAAASGTKAYIGELPPFNEKLAQMQKAIADEAWGRDPFRAPIVKESDLLSTSWKDFKLSGVIPGRTATINGEIIGVGEEFEGYTLIRVDNYRITLEKSEKPYILSMPED